MRTWAVQATKATGTAVPGFQGIDPALEIRRADDGIERSNTGNVAQVVGQARHVMDMPHKTIHREPEFPVRDAAILVVPLLLQEKTMVPVASST